MKSLDLVNLYKINVRHDWVNALFTYTPTAVLPGLRRFPHSAIDFLVAGLDGCKVFMHLTISTMMISICNHIARRINKGSASTDI